MRIFVEIEAQDRACASVIRDDVERIVRDFPDKLRSLVSGSNLNISHRVAPSGKTELIVECDRERWNAVFGSINRVLSEMHRGAVVFSTKAHAKSG